MLPENVKYRKKSPDSFLVLLNVRIEQESSHSLINFRQVSALILSKYVSPSPSAYWSIYFRTFVNFFLASLRCKSSKRKKSLRSTLQLRISFSETWELVMFKNVNIKKSRIPFSQFLWEGRSLTLEGIVLQVVKLPHVVKIRESLFSSG